MNIKNILFKIGSYAIICIAILGLIIFYVGMDRGNQSFMIIGFLIMSPFISWGIIWYVKNKKIKKDNLTELENLKKTADKITVDISTAVIETNSWSHEEIVARGDVAMWNEIGGHGHKNVKTITKIESIVSWKFDYNGKPIPYSIAIGKDAQTLKIHFAIQKETTLYVDKNNPDNNYLDLEFLH